MSKIIILFDIDGTLLLTGGAGKDAFNHVFKELYNEDEIWNNIHPDGRTDYSLIKECYEKRFKKSPSATEIKNIKTAYENIFLEKLASQSNFRLMPFVKDVLNKLSQNKSLLLGIATGNFQKPAWQKLKHGGIDHHFSFGGFSCDSEHRLELTQAAKLRGEKILGETAKKIYVIGDSIHDVRCGNAIDATTIAVCTGSTSRNDLEKNGAHHVIDNLSELSKLI